MELTEIYMYDILVAGLQVKTKSLAGDMYHDD